MEASFIDISSDGIAWQPLGWVNGGADLIDIDAFGFGPNDEFFFVRITDDPNQGGPDPLFAGADIDAVEALSGNAFPADSDFDFACDNSDNCLLTSNADQSDVDGDGVGDACDNCVDAANEDQIDTSGNGTGDACQPAVISLRPVAGALVPTFDLFLDCRGVAMKTLNIGMLIPPASNAASINFGGNCDNPVNPPPGIAAGLGCTANSLLGASVDPALSGAYIPPPGTDYDENSVYTKLVGNGPNGEICLPGDGEIPSLA